MSSECFDLDSTVPQVIDRDLKIKEEPVAAPKVKYLTVVVFLLHESHVLTLCSFVSENKGREPAPRLYISAEELDSLSSLVLTLQLGFYLTIYTLLIKSASYFYVLGIMLSLQLHEGETNYGKG